MERTGKYYEACNDLFRALGELDMWVDAMNSAIAKMDDVDESERQKLGAYILEEIGRIDSRFASVKKEFVRKLNEKGLDEIVQET